MRLGMKYDLGAGPEVASIGVQAQVAWELRTKRKIGSMAEDVSMTDMVGLLMEQLRIDGKLPDGVVNELTLSKHLVDMDPETTPDPT